MRPGTIADCMRERLLREVPQDLGKSCRSREISQKRLAEAEKAIALEVYPYAILESYNAMFHAARAVLYRDGIQEKSHYAVYVYLRERYADRIPEAILNLLNIHRAERHETLYGLEYEPGANDAKTALKDAKTFAREVERVLDEAA